MKENIVGIMAEILKIDQETLLTRFDDRTVWDSLSRVEILFAIEEEFDIQFSEEELAVLITPQKLCEATIGKAEEA